MWWMSLIGGGGGNVAPAPGMPQTGGMQPPPGSPQVPGSLQGGNMVAPPTGEAQLIPPPGGGPTPNPALPPGTIMGMPSPTMPTPGYTADNAMFQIENAGTLAMNQQAGVAPDTGPVSVDAAGTPTTPPPGKPPAEDAEKGFNWMSLIGGGGGNVAPAAGGQTRGTPDQVKHMQINPQTGLIEWV